MVNGQVEQLGRCVRRSLEVAALAQRSDEQLLSAFLSRSDPSAFAALVRRHGPLVLSACRQVLREEADVEDVFQATFLVLLHKAASIRRGQALGTWLFRVARHLALKARADQARRRQYEGRAAERDVPTATPDDPSWREACAALHEELDRLPEKYRLPLVLCYLQGLSRDEAARQLGWSLGAVKGRLERGRRLLHERLGRRGLALSAGLLAALVSSQAVGKVLPPRLVQITLHAATSGRRSVAVAALVEGANHAMFPSKVPVVASLLLVTGLLVGGVTLRQLPTHAAIVAEPARGPEAELKWRFTEGKAFYQTMTTTTTQNMTVTGTKIAQKQEQTFFFEWKVVKVDKDKVTLKQKIIGLKMSLDIGGGKVFYDSTVPGKPANDPLFKFFATLKDASFTITIDTKEMKVLSLEGHDKLVAKVKKANPQMKPLLEKILSKEALLDMQSTTMFTALPGKKVKKNETWRRKSTLDMAAIGRYETTYTYTYEGPGKDKNEKIGGKTELKYSPPHPQAAGGLPFTINNAKLEAKDASSTIIYDPKAGWIKSFETKMKLTGSLIIGIGQQSTGVELTQDQTTKIITTAANPLKK